MKLAPPMMYVKLVKVFECVRVLRGKWRKWGSRASLIWGVMLVFFCVHVHAFIFVYMRYSVYVLCMPVYDEYALDECVDEYAV